MRAAFLALVLSLSASVAMAQQSYIQIQVLVMPNNDPGRFNILVDGQMPAGWANLGNGDLGSAYPFPVGQHTLTVTGANGTNVAQYQVGYSTQTQGQWATCNADGTVDITTTLSAYCVITFTNQIPPAPVLSSSAGTSVCPNTVTLRDDDLHATISFTTDGSTPSANSTQYTNPISVTASQKITAIAWNVAGTSAAVAVTFFCPGEAVQCFVFDDGYTNMAGPSQAIFISGRSGQQGKACIPDSGPFGTCRKWFGRCSSVAVSAPVRFSVFDDGNTNFYGDSDAVYIPSTGNQACLPDQTAIGICRKWFGQAADSAGRRVSCSVFDDGGSNQAGPANATYIPGPIPGPGSVCIPDQTATGTCRRWFGNCTAN